MDNHGITFTLNHLVTELNNAADAILRQRFALTYSQFIFLLTLYSCGFTTASGLAASLGVSRAAVSKRTEWFVTRGLVEVDSSSQDKRAVQLSLTAPGESLVRDAAALLEAEFHRLFSSLEREAQVDLDAFHRTLTIVHEGLRGYNAGSPPTHAHHRGE